MLTSALVLAAVILTATGTAVSQRVVAHVKPVSSSLKSGPSVASATRKRVMRLSDKLGDNGRVRMSRSSSRVLTASARNPGEECLERNEMHCDSCFNDEMAELCHGMLLHGYDEVSEDESFPDDLYSSTEQSDYFALATKYGAPLEDLPFCAGMLYLTIRDEICRYPGESRIEAQGFMFLARETYLPKGGKFRLVQDGDDWDFEWERPEENCPDGHCDESESPEHGHATTTTQSGGGYGWWARRIRQRCSSRRVWNPWSRRYVWRTRCR